MNPQLPLLSQLPADVRAEAERRLAAEAAKVRRALPASLLTSCRSPWSNGWHRVIDGACRNRGCGVSK